MRVRAIRWAYVAAVAVFLVSVARYHHRNTGFTSLICFGDEFEKVRLPAVADAPHYVHYQSSGYDGQFYAQLAVEPLLRDGRLEDALDEPAYRARRILFAWTAYLLGLGRPGWVLKAYALQNIVAWLLLAWVLLRWFPPTAPRHLAAWLACLFGAGLITSVRFALTEGPALLLLALSVAAMEQGRRWLAPALMALAGLGREMSFLAGGLLLDRRPANRREALAAAARLFAVVLPFAAWVAYVSWVYPPTGSAEGRNFAIPFTGYLHKWSVTLGQLHESGWWGSWARFSLAALVSVPVQAGFLLARRDWGSAWWRAGATFAALVPFLSFPVWEGDVIAVMRVALPMSVAFNVLVVRSRFFWPLVVSGNLTVLHGLHMINVPWLAGVL